MTINLGVHLEGAVIEVVTLQSPEEEFDVVRVGPDLSIFVRQCDAQIALRLADALRASALKYGAVEEQAVTA